ncbi:MAG: hypothetical protein IGR92_08960 [Leptolyngbyaceae cyanobacterium T60_A2020_046]|nr:hypothetical protein [Leptolyngbyaceae cyanobacterium T60_A2020_046]
MSSSLEFHLSVQDGQSTDEDLQAMLVALAAELENQAAEVTATQKVEMPSPSVDGLPVPPMIPKGDGGTSILNVKINLEALQTFGLWLHKRLAGTTTKVNFEYEGIKFAFEGRSDRDRAAAMQDFQDFIAQLEAAKREAAKREAAKREAAKRG